jgi:predicted RecA/RadA family phage recombinase
MNVYIQPGEVLTLTAPYTRTSGQGAQVGSIFGVACNDVTSGAEGEFATEGVYRLAKTSAQAWTVGQKIYWDNSNKRCDTVSTVGILIGVATAVAANPSSTGNVKLNCGFN